MDIENQEPEQLDENALFNEMAEQREDGAVDNDFGNDDGNDDVNAFTGEADSGDADSGNDAPSEADAQFEGWPQEAINQYNEQVTAKEALEHRIASDDGRVAAFQRKADDAQAQLNQARTQSTDNPTDDDITKALETDEGWKEFKTEHPEIATAIDDRISASMKLHQERVDTTLAPMVQREQQSDLVSAQDAVSEQFPTWLTHAPNSDHYKSWIEAQPYAVRNLAESDEVSDALSLMDIYDNRRVADGLESMRTKVDLTSNDVDNGTRNLNARRQEQLNDGSSIESKPAGVSDAGGGDSNDLETMWNVMAEKRERAKQRA